MKSFSKLEKINNLEDSYGLISGFDGRTGTKLGSNTIKFGKVAYGSQDTGDVESHLFNSNDFAFGFMISEQEDGSHRGVVEVPILLESMFTRLFYFEGAQTSHFEKFYDQTNVFGVRIIIWKVLWDEYE